MLLHLFSVLCVQNVDFYSLPSSKSNRFLHRGLNSTQTHRQANKTTTREAFARPRKHGQAMSEF